MDWSYIAGYFDGEGHVGLHRHGVRKGSSITTLTWHNSHLASLEAMHSYMGVGYVRKTRGGGFDGKKQMYTLSISSKLPLLYALDNMLPHLLVKREAAEALREHLVAHVNEKRAENYGKLLAIPKEQYEVWYFTEGKSYAEIAAMFGATPSGIARLFRLYGLEARPAGGTHLLGTTKPDEVKARMKASRQKLWQDPAFREQQLRNLSKGAKGSRMNASGGSPPGEHHHQAKLTDAKVVSIRADYAAGKASLSSLAVEHGVSKKTILNVVHNKIWTHVPAGNG